MQEVLDEVVRLKDDAELQTTICSMLGAAKSYTARLMTGWDRYRIPQWTDKMSFSIQSLESFFAHVDKAVAGSPSGNIFNRLDFAVGRFNKVDDFVTSTLEKSARNSLFRQGYDLAWKLSKERREANSDFETSFRVFL